MKVQTALDWQNVSGPLMEQMRTAPYSTRKDLARMLGNIEHMVQELASEEVNMRRARKQQTPVQQQWLAQIDEAIGDFQHWALLAHLSGT